MASSIRHHLINNLDLMTNLSIGAFHKIFLIDNNGDEQDITNIFLSQDAFDNFLESYNEDIEYLIKLHKLQDVQINGGTFHINSPIPPRPELPTTFTSDGKADKYHMHEIPEVRLLPETLNAKRDKTDYNFRNTNNDLYINGLKFICDNQNKDLCVVLADINEKLEKLIDSIYGLDLITDFETIFDVVSKFLNPLNPYNWEASYFENTNLKNGLIHALINFLTGRFTNLIAPYADTADSQYFIPSNHRYTRKNRLNQIIYPIYKSNNTNIWGHYPVYNRVAFSNNGIQSFSQDESISGLISRYNNLSTSNTGFNYRQALILDDTPLEFKNNAKIALDTTSGDVFKITSGKYYWKNLSDNINNLSILNGIEKELMFMNDETVVFYNRLRDKSGKRYILEDEVNLDSSPFNTLIFFNDESLYIDTSKRYTTNNFNDFNDFTQNNYYDNSKIYKTYNNSFNNSEFNSYFEKNTINTNINLDEQNYINLKKVNLNNYFEDNINFTSNIKNNYNTYFDTINDYIYNIDNKKYINNIFNDENVYNVNNIFNKINQTNNNFNTDDNLFFNSKKYNHNNFYNYDELNQINNKIIKISNNTVNYQNEDNYTQNIIKKYTNNNIENIQNNTVINQHTYSQIYDINNFNTTNTKYVQNIINDNVYITENINKNTYIKNQYQNNTDNLHYLINNKYNNTFLNDFTTSYNENKTKSLYFSYDTTDYNILNKQIINNNILLDETINNNNFISQKSTVNLFYDDKQEINILNKKYNTYNNFIDDNVQYMEYKYNNIVNNFNTDILEYNISNITKNINNCIVYNLTNETFIYNTNIKKNTVNNQYDNQIISTKKNTFNSYYDDNLFINTSNYTKNDNSVSILENNDTINNNNKFIYNNLIDNNTKNIILNKNIINSYLENNNQNINQKKLNWFIINDIQNIYYAPSNNTSINYDDTSILNRLINVENNIASINNTLNNYNTRITNNENSINSVNNTLNTHNTRITNIDISLSNQNTRLVLVEGAVNNILTRLDSLEGKATVYQALKIQNIFYVSNNPTPVNPSNLNGTYIRLPYGSTETLPFAYTTGYNTTSGITISGDEIYIQKSGQYQFTLNLQFLFYSGWSKNTGTSFIYFVSNNIILLSHQLFLSSDNYATQTVVFHYIKTDNNNIKIQINFNNLINSISNSPFNENSLFLQTEACKLNIIRFG